jgi:hypothetical protein
MQKIRLIITTSAIVLIIFYASSCKKKNITVYDCTGLTPTYTADVKTILDTHCATSSCHNASSKAHGIDLSSYTAAKNEAERKNFLGSVQRISGYTAMPEGASKQDDATINTLSCWVQNGEPQ